MVVGNLMLINGDLRSIIYRVGALFTAAIIAQRAFKLSNEMGCRYRPASSSNRVLGQLIVQQWMLFSFFLSGACHAEHAEPLCSGRLPCSLERAED